MSMLSTKFNTGMSITKGSLLSTLYVLKYVGVTKGGIAVSFKFTVSLYIAYLDSLHVMSFII